LAHMALLDLFDDVMIIASRHGLRMSFYVDDIAISGSKAAVMGATTEVIATVQRHGHSVRNRKKKLMIGDEQEVTGLNVHNGVHVPRSYIDEVELQIMQAVQAGTTSATNYASLKGKVGYVTRVDAPDGERLKDLLRYVSHGTHQVRAV